MSSSTLVATANVLNTLGLASARDCLTDLLARHPDLVGLQEWVRRGAGRCGRPVGAHADRYRVLESRSRILGRFDRPDAGVRTIPVLPPRAATRAHFVDRTTTCTLAVINYHPVPGVQTRGRYRDDRPLLVARHRLEVRRLRALVDEQLAQGHVVHALGDSNFDGLRLPGLTSAGKAARTTRAARWVPHASSTTSSEPASRSRSPCWRTRPTTRLWWS